MVMLPVEQILCHCLCHNRKENRKSRFQTNLNRLHSEREKPGIHANVTSNLPKLYKCTIKHSPLHYNLLMGLFKGRRFSQTGVIGIIHWKSNIKYLWI